MTSENPHAPASLRLVHGMEHAGLGRTALAIERSRDFKRAFSKSISVDLGFADRSPELALDSGEGEHVARFLESFGPDGHPPEAETRAFLDAELASRSAHSGVATGTLVRDCCIRFLSGWLNCGGYTVLRGGEPWTAAAAVAAYEEAHGPIADAGARAELAAIGVYVQLEWEIAL